MPRVIPKKSRLGLLMLLALTQTISTGGCSTDPLSCACTEIFVSSLIEVKGVDGAPAVGVTLTITRTSDGTIVVPTSASQAPGTYTIMTDSQLDFVNEAGTEFRVEGTLGAASFSALYVFDTDACRCHINWVSGPTSVQLMVGGQ